MPGKVTIIGAGNVGTAAAFATALDGTPDELVLFDIDPKKAEGEMLDIDHASAFIPHTDFMSTGEYSDTNNSDVIVITAGARQAEGETRLDLIEKNHTILASILDEVVPLSPDAILLIVSNPVDVLTFYAQELSGFVGRKVIGTGTVLDTARLKSFLEIEFKVNSQNIDAFVIGEHGDSSFAVLDAAHIASVPLDQLPGYNRERVEGLHEKVRKAAYEVIEKKGYTNLAIGVCVSKILYAILNNTHEIFPVTAVLEGEYGISGCALSTPSILGRNGIEKKLELPLSEKESEMLEKCATLMKEVIAKQNKK